MTAPRALRLALFALCATFATFAVLASPADAAPTAAELAKDRVAAAEKAFRSATAMYAAGRATTETVYAWSLRWLDATLDAALDAAPEAAKQPLADHQKRMADLEATVKKMFATGTASKLDADSAAYFRREADLWVTRGKR